MLKRAELHYSSIFASPHLGYFHSAKFAGTINPMNKKTIVQVAVPVPLYGVFDYLLPSGTEHDLHKGCRVSIPFGRKQLIGMVVNVGVASDLPVSKLKPLSECIDSESVISSEIIKLLEWAAVYYHYPLGEVLFSALPKSLRQGEAAELKQENIWKLTEEGGAGDIARLSRAPKQAALLAYMQNTDQLELYASQLNADWDSWRAPMQGLVDKQLVETGSRVPNAIAQSRQLIEARKLNEEQVSAANSIANGFAQYQAFLLQGITGSGKTEVYLDVIDKALVLDLQVLVLVPEISLTPQLTQRFMARLDTQIVSLHSGLNDSQRHAAWVQASKGVARVLIGTRSALFTPMPELGLVIIDEEHDASFKQQEGFRYHARDLALVRAKNKNIPIVLGSATPSLESLENVTRGQFKLLRLSQRGVQGAMPPKVSLLDVCRRPMEDGISDQLLVKVKEHLDNKGQVLLFLNRRGYAPLLMCHECGWTAVCQRCDANMTLHQHNRKLRCHHCGYETAAPHECPECQHESLYIPGAGTERIELALKSRFPDVVISRIDRDTTRRKGELDEKLKQARSGEAQILIGTQMLAKGHDFPDLTLVGILNADQGLFSADFRGTEHMAQLIIQVAGRAGRSEKPGEVIIQTHHPEHPLLHTLLESGYVGFAKEALKERKQAGFPPYSYMAILRCDSINKEHGQMFLNDSRQVFAYTDVELFGPLPAPMEKRAGRYRWQLILLARDRRNLHAVMRDWMPKVIKLKSVNKVRWSIDIDPLDMF